MKRLQVLLCLLFSSLWNFAKGQEVCGILSASGNVLVVFTEGRTDTFFQDLPMPQFYGGGWSSRDTLNPTARSNSDTSNAAAGATASISREDSLRIITQYRTIYREEMVQAAAPEGFEGMTSEEIKNLIEAAEKAEKQNKKLEKEKLEHEKEVAKLAANTEKNKERDERKALRREGRNDSTGFHLNINLEPIGEGLLIAGGAIGIGVGAAVGAVGIAVVGVGTAVVATGKFLARPFKKCDCEGDASEESVEKDGNPSPEGKVIHRHGRKVKPSKKPKKKRARGKKGHKCTALGS